MKKNIISIIIASAICVVACVGGKYLNAPSTKEYNICGCWCDNGRYEIELDMGNYCCIYDTNKKIYDSFNDGKNHVAIVSGIKEENYIILNLK